jgi:hypothetical protein
MKTTNIFSGLITGFGLLGMMAMPGCSLDPSPRDEPESLGSVTQAASQCGNGILELGEQCDNGTSNSDIDPDACRTNCEPAHCGDAIVDFGESCDPYECSEGFYRESWCNSAYYAPTCTPNTCGNGYPNNTTTTYGKSEACDDHNSEDGDTCRSDCGQDMTKCGNNLVDQGEQCDLGPTLNSDLPNKMCRKNCQAARCGDGIVDNLAVPPEQCDRNSGCGPDCTWL